MHTESFIKSMFLTILSWLYPDSILALSWSGPEE